MAARTIQAKPIASEQRVAESEAAQLAHEYRWLLRSARFVVPVFLFLAAFALRLPYLMEVPGFTDETIDVKVGLEALNGHWPLVDAEPYIGSLFNFLLAAGFKVLGQDAYVPRFIVTVLGALTVVLAYFLARRLAGTTAALLTAGLLATSGVHIVTGHIAWSNCITPFFTTAALLAIVEAVSRSNGRLLVAGGALYGLALQTHASAIFLAPAIAAHLLITWVAPRATNWPQLVTELREVLSRLGRRRPRHGLGTGLHRASRQGQSAIAQPGSLLFTRWPYLAALAMVFTMSNVIAYNLLNPGGWGTATERQTAYAYVDNPTVGSYVQNLHAIGTTLIRMVSSSFGGGASLGAQALLPGNALYVALLLAGIGYAIWRRQFLLLVGVLTTALLMPYLNKNYEFPIGVRYLGFLLPLLYLMIALPLARVLEALWQRAQPGAIALGGVCLLLVAFPLVNLFNYYESYLRQGATNPTILALQDEIQARYEEGLIGEVWLDPQLDWVYTAPGGRALRAFDLLFSVEQVPHRTVWMEPGQVKRETADATKSVVLIVSAASLQRLGDGFGLTRLEVAERPYLQRDGYWAYLLRRP